MHIIMLLNVLDTYLEVVDLHEQQKEWEDYEQSLNALIIDYIEPIYCRMLEEMQLFLPNGGVCLIAPAMESWSNVLTSKFSKNSPYLGLMMEDKSVAYEAVKKGFQFLIFILIIIQNLFLARRQTEGASYSIPLMVHDRRQAVVAAYDSDPLSFKESTKHKLANLVRIASLAIQSVVKKSSVIDELLTENYGAIRPNLKKALENNRKNKNKNIHTWFGLITPNDLSSLRTKYRLEELQRIQKDFVTFLNPGKHGIPGYIGFNSDYVFFSHTK